MTPSLHKEQPVDNFLCEDSCVCGHAGQTVEVRQCDSGGLLLLLLCSPLNPLLLLCILCSILSLVSCQLRLLPCCPSSLFTPFPLSGLFIPSTPPPQSALARFQHPRQSRNAPVCPYSLGQSVFSPCLMIICCHWFHDTWERTLMIFLFFIFSVFRTTSGCQSSPHWLSPP